MKAIEELTYITGEISPPSKWTYGNREQEMHPNQTRLSVGMLSW